MKRTRQIYDVFMRAIKEGCIPFGYSFGKRSPMSKEAMAVVPPPAGAGAGGGSPATTAAGGVGRQIRLSR
jgi:hypothetical protein